MPRSRWIEVGNGFRLALSWLLFMMWLFLAFVGMGAVQPPEGRVPPIVGWLCLGAAALIAVLATERWVKAFPAILGYGVCNGLFMIATGHLVNDASKAIARVTAAVITVLAAGATIIAIPLASRRPTGIGRLAAFGVFASLLLGLVNERFTVWSFTLMFWFVALAWWADRIRRRPRR